MFLNLPKTRAGQFEQTLMMIRARSSLEGTWRHLVPVLAAPTVGPNIEIHQVHINIEVHIKSDPCE